jgi:hypothetical protein
MIKLDLAKFCKKEHEIIESLFWVTDRLGPAGEKWRIEDLRFLYFFNDKDATFFILRWS